MSEQLGRMTWREFRAWVIAQQNAGRGGPIHPDIAAALDRRCDEEAAQPVPPAGVGSDGGAA